MAKIKVINVYKVKKDINGIPPTGMTDENYEKLSIIGNVTNAQGVSYNDKNNLETNNVQDAIDKIITEGSSKIKYNNTKSKLQATNVQNAIDELQDVKNIIYDQQEHSAGFFYNGKPVYYRSLPDTDSSTERLYYNEGNIWNIDEAGINKLTTSTNRSGDTYYFDVVNYNSCTIQIYINNLTKQIIVFRYTFQSGNYVNKLKNCIIYYTKTTDSRII